MVNISEDNITAFSSHDVVSVYSNDYLRSSEFYVINNIIKLGDRVPDVGVGTGRTTRYIYKRGVKVIGIEPAQLLLEEAKKLSPEIEFVNMNVLDLGFKDESFDVVFFSFNGLDNLFPVENREKAILEMRRVLKTGGFLAFSSHNSLCVPHTVPGWRIILLNLLYLRPWGHYRNEKLLGNKIVQFYGNVWGEKKRLEKLMFGDVFWIANGRVRFWPKICAVFFERFPMFIAKKI